MGDRQRGRRAAPPLPPNGAPDPERRPLTRQRARETAQGLRAEANEMLRRQGRSQDINRARLRGRTDDGDDQEAGSADGDAMELNPAELPAGAAPRDAGDDAMEVAPAGPAAVPAPRDASYTMDVILAGQPAAPAPREVDFLHELPAELFRKIMSLLDVRDVARLAATARPFRSLLGADSPYGKELRVQAVTSVTPPMVALKAMADPLAFDAAAFSEADMARLLKRLHTEYYRCFRENMDSDMPIHLTTPQFRAPFWLSERLRHAYMRAMATLPDRPAHPLELQYGKRYFMWQDRKWRRFPEEDVKDTARRVREDNERMFMETFRAHLMGQPAMPNELRDSITRDYAQRESDAQAGMAVARQMDEDFESHRIMVSQIQRGRNSFLRVPLTLREALQRGYPLIGHAIYNCNMARIGLDTATVFRTMLQRERHKRIAYYMLSGIGTQDEESYVAPVMTVYEFVSSDYALLMEVIHTGDTALIDTVMKFGAYWSRPRGLTHEEIASMVERDPTLVTLGDLRRSLVKRHRRELRLGSSVVAEPLTQHEAEEVQFNQFMDIATPLADEIIYRQEPPDWMNVPMQHYLGQRLCVAPHDQPTVMTVLKHMRPNLPLCHILLEDCAYKETLATIYAYQARVLGNEWTPEVAKEFVLNRICQARPHDADRFDRDAEALKAWDVSSDGAVPTYTDAELGTVALPRVDMVEAVSWRLLRRRHYAAIFIYLLQCMDKRLQRIERAGGSEVEKAAAEAFITGTQFRGGWRELHQALKYLLPHCRNAAAVLDSTLQQYAAEGTTYDPAALVKLGRFIDVVLTVYKQTFYAHASTAEFMNALLPKHPLLYGCLKYLPTTWNSLWSPAARLECLVHIARATPLPPHQQTIRPAFWRYWQFLTETMALRDQYMHDFVLSDLHACAPTDLLIAITLTTEYADQHDLVPSWRALGEIRPSMSEAVRLAMFKGDVDDALLRIFAAAYENNFGDVVSRLLQVLSWVRRQLAAILNILLDPPPVMPSRLRIPPQLFNDQVFPRSSRTYTSIYRTAVEEATASQGSASAAFEDEESAMQFLDRLGLPRPAG